MGAISTLTILIIGLVVSAVVLADPAHATPPSIGDAPAMHISNLPNINETAFVRIVYTNTSPPGISNLPIGWSVSQNMEIVDSYGVPYKPQYHSAEDNFRRYTHDANTPLESGESITFNIKIKAVSKGPAWISSWGFDSSHISMYLDSDNTMLYNEYLRLHPEPRAPPSQPRDDGEKQHSTSLTEEQSQALYERGEISSTMNSIAAHIQREGYTASEAVDFFIAETRTFTMPQIQYMLNRAGFVSHDVEAVLSPSKQLQLQIPADQVQCRNELLLLVQSPSGRTACVFGASLENLERRGFVLLDTVRNWSSTCPINPSAASVYSESNGASPSICMSNLPNVGETATVKIGYMWDYVSGTAGVQGERRYPGWHISPNFEIVDSNGMPYRTVYHPGTDTVIDYRHVSDIHLESGESITYEIEVRAIKEGPAMITGWGYAQENTSIMLYLDSEETMFYQEHRDLHPDAYMRDTAGLSHKSR